MGRPEGVNTLFEFKVRTGGFLYVYRGTSSRFGDYKLERRSNRSRAYNLVARFDREPKKEETINFVLSRPGVALIEG